MSSSPKPQPVPEDPAIAKERARRQSLVISQSEQRRSSKFGSGGTALTRKGEDLTAPDTAKFAASQKSDTIKQLEQKLSSLPQFTSSSDEGGGDINAEFKSVQDKLNAAKESISATDKAELSAAQKDASILDLIKRNRKRMGTSKTGA